MSPSTLIGHNEADVFRVKNVEIDGVLLPANALSLANSRHDGHVTRAAAFDAPPRPRSTSRSPRYFHLGKKKLSVKADFFSQMHVLKTHVSKRMDQSDVSGE